MAADTSSSPRPAKPSGFADAPPRAWQRMLSGRRLDLLDPSPVDVEIEDIAHGLARVARWNGQTRGAYAYSVAQHSLLVEALLRAESPSLEPRWLLAALLHDGPEYVIGDMISPFKAAIGGDYKRIESALMRAIHIRFGLPAELPEAITSRIKRADKVAAFTEAVDVAGFDEPEARRILAYRRKARGPVQVAMAPQEAKQAFLARFGDLFVA